MFTEVNLNFAHSEIYDVSSDDHSNALYQVSNHVDKRSVNINVCTIRLLATPLFFPMSSLSLIMTTPTMGMSMTTVTMAVLV